MRKRVGLSVVTREPSDVTVVTTPLRCDGRAEYRIVVVSVVYLASLVVCHEKRLGIGHRYWRVEETPVALFT